LDDTVATALDIAAAVHLSRVEVEAIKSAGRKDETTETFDSVEVW
jgi:hypothetical protein